MNSQLMLYSNLMVDDDEHRPAYRFMPGDYLPIVFPEFRDVQKRNALTPQQLVELDQYLVCVRCGRKCAGTCETELR